MARRTGRRRWMAATVVVALGTAAVIWGPEVWRQYGDRVFSSDRCTVTIDGSSAELTAEQADNAALISAVAISRGLPRRAAVVALATAYQESDLRNVDFGDRDSLGLFQQRPSQGWGTEAEVTDRHFATGAFYDALVRVAAWDVMPVTDAAQSVQRSAFPDAYADHEADAELWSLAFFGEAAPSSVQCTPGLTSGITGDVDALDARLLADFAGTWTLTRSATADGGQVVDITGLGGIPVSALAAWSIAVGTVFGIDTVEWCSGVWSRATGTWANPQPAAPECDSTVRLTTAPPPS